MSEPAGVEITPEPELDLGLPPRAAPVPSAMPPPVTDFGPVRLELMGHRYREGQLAEVVIAGTSFLRLTTGDGGEEYYRPDAVYCITPGLAPPPRAAIPSGWRDDDDEFDDDDDRNPF